MTNERIVERGRDIADTMRTAGWAELEALVTDEMEGLVEQRDELIGSITARLKEGASSEALTAEIAELTGRIEGRSSILEIAKQALREKQSAEQKL